jgi:peptide/nickel transport system permease protein
MSQPPEPKGEAMPPAVGPSAEMTPVAVAVPPPTLPPADITALGFDSSLDTAPINTPWRDGMRRMLRNRLAVAGLCIIGFLALGAVLAPVIATEHPQKGGIWAVNPKLSKAAPAWEHPLGRDQLGRDQLSRMLYGARVSLLIGFAAVSLAIVIGMLLGSLAGFHGGWTDTGIMRVMDIMLAFPSILLALAIVAIIGPGLMNVLLAVGIISIPTYARIVRSSVLGEKTREYIDASVALGADRRRVLFRHILPNSLSPLIVAASLGIGTAILDAAGLGFLGLGGRPPLAEWGLMLSDNRQKLFSEWWLVAVPGIAIMLTVLGFNLLGDGLRDVLDPRLRGGRG